MDLLHKVFLSKVSLPPFEKYCLFQKANLLLNLSSSTSHTEGDLNDALKGKPK